MIIKPHTHRPAHWAAFTALLAGSSLAVPALARDAAWGALALLGGGLIALAAARLLRPRAADPDEQRLADFVELSSDWLGGDITTAKLAEGAVGGGATFYFTLGPG